MTNLEFIASIIDTLAWPIVVLIVVFLFRKPLSKSLLGLSRFKYNDLELNFGRELNKIEDAIDNSKLIVDSESYEKNKMDALDITEINPFAAIIVAWMEIEKEIGNLINKLAISPDYPGYNSSLKNINLLKEQGYIDSLTYELINDLRHLRNQVAHNKIEAVTYLEAVKYCKLANKISNTLKNITRE
ncbi:MAG: hypothetical protein N4A76_04020 [Firmicutes bacterium]|jgi:hypothetical protein|nr:hypothetical protein [Bacillota bacterium]